MLPNSNNIARSESEVVSILEKYGVKIRYKPIAIVTVGPGYEEEKDVYEVLATLENSITSKDPFS
jgi:menaquinone-dependent protoporphyrinogen IX oxidase